ncbi:YafY family transcriptional regulator [Bacillus sp. Xin]|uniref:helix-turn-helix transcriptional regulator n=1 Tax=unclassified Bacillus (in: firmicutes) TaxID=185979 RepID=UPI0015718157|nr:MULTISPECIES: YafY family protein [unclassified Bacillus (in: firmicutes)]MBC6971375.1 YafY family transcriptional regulator [Bacillus sp. Xin]NSW35864.1 YafY family transcriptional regulator [Bacillus sp. Xin1]
MKTERMFSILIYLLKKDIVSAEELANRFEVSKRTIYRDIDALSAIGIPIISYLGKNGGFTLIDNYQLDKFTFNEEEKKFLLEGLTLKNELFDNDQLLILQKKLELLKENKEEHHSNITISSSTLHRETIEEETKVKIKKILSVINEGNKIRISYVSQTANISSRMIQPLKLNFMNGSWYLEAFCESRKALRLFKLTRIRSMEIIHDNTRTPYTEKNEYVTNKIAKIERIILLFSKSELGKLYDFFTDDEIEVLEDGELKVTFPYDSNKNILPFLLMFGRHVKIIEPLWLKNKYRDEIEYIYKS